MSRSPLLLGTTTEREMATRMGQSRMIIGGSTLLAAGMTGLAKLVYGLNPEHDNATARALGRLFGIRNLVIGAWTLKNRDADLDTRRRWYAINALIDIVDVSIFALPLLRRQGTARLSITSGALGSSAALGWLDLLETSAAESAARSLV
jgi:hypothetical protein